MKRLAIKPKAFVSVTSMLYKKNLWHHLLVTLSFKLSESASIWNCGLRYTNESNVLECTIFAKIMHLNTFDDFPTFLSKCFLELLFIIASKLIARSIGVLKIRNPPSLYPLSICWLQRFQLNKISRTEHYMRERDW